MKRIPFILLLLVISFFSCTDNTTEINTIFFTDTSDRCIELRDDLDPNFSGVWCCIQRNTEANESNIIEYEYLNVGIDNAVSEPNLTYEWEVHSGDIEILSGADTNKVTILLKDSFTIARLRCTGYDDGFGGEVCAELITINRLDF